MLEQRSASSASDDDLGAVQVDPPKEWVAALEPPSDEMRLRPSGESGFARPGCWNCGEFGHSRIHCNRPTVRYFAFFFFHNQIFLQPKGLQGRSRSDFKAKAM